MRQQLADLQIKGALEPMALKHRVRADALEDVQNRYRRAFPSGHKSAEELENFFTGLSRYLFDPGTAYHKDAEHKDTQGGPTLLPRPVSNSTGGNQSKMNSTFIDLKQPQQQTTEQTRAVARKRTIARHGDI